MNESWKGAIQCLTRKLSIQRCRALANYILLVRSRAMRKSCLASEISFWHELIVGTVLAELLRQLNCGWISLPRIFLPSRDRDRSRSELAGGNMTPGV
jgi:hypothetical protein